VGEHHTESTPVPHPAASDTTNPLSFAQAQVQAPDSGRINKSVERVSEEDNGEVIVEGDEDTVIY
jgi:hypothetical protein